MAIFCVQARQRSGCSIVLQWNICKYILLKDGSKLWWLFYFLCEHEGVHNLPHGILFFFSKLFIITFLGVDVFINVHYVLCSRTWIGLRHHVIGEHDWSLMPANMVHEALSELFTITTGWGRFRITNILATHTNRFFVRFFYLQLSLIVTNKFEYCCWDIKDLMDFLKVFYAHRSTDELESFHNHILLGIYGYMPYIYVCQQRLIPPVFKEWILLAGLDYNHHVHRSPMRRPNGTIELFN